MSMMDILHIEGSRDTDLRVPISSAVALFVQKYCSHPTEVILYDTDTKENVGRSCVTLPATSLDDLCFKWQDTESSRKWHCTLPALAKQDSNKILSGLGCVSRGIVKSASLRHPQLTSVLGFKQICLKACAEVSAWTKFCEIDMPSAVEKVLREHRRGSTQDALHVPEELMKLECQFKEPLVVSNISKRKRQKQASSEKESPSFDLQHTFVEGLDFTLVDLIIFPCVSIILNTWSISLKELARILPETMKWFSVVCALPRVTETMKWCGLPVVDPRTIMDSSSGVVPEFNYPANCGPVSTVREARKKFKANSAEVDRVRESLKRLSLEEPARAHTVRNDVISWADVPDAVHPKDGDLPASRLKRKCEQLENLSSAVLSLAKSGDTIVDFCSGGGHLAILLAFLRPDCQVILVENKEESIVKAELRIEKLALQNMSIYQCNLGYFHAPFDVGVCLHACGVATDLVMQKCVKERASFVICPCCYGGIQNTHTVTYPRSDKFKELGISYKDIQVLGHAADKTEFSIPLAAIGKQCMVYIDSDRMSYAVEHGYKVTLSTLDPPTCSPKNNLLVGTRTPFSLPNGME